MPRWLSLLAPPVQSLHSLSGQRVKAGTAHDVTGRRVPQPCHVGQNLGSPHKWRPSQELRQGELSPIIPHHPRTLTCFQGGRVIQLCPHLCSFGILFIHPAIYPSITYSEGISRFWGEMATLKGKANFLEFRHGKLWRTRA